MSNISNFISSFSKDTARVSNFESLVVIPPALIGSYPNGMNQLRFRCEATELPGRTFATVDQKTYGPIEVFPVQNYYDKITLTFICSDTMEERKFFDKWMDYISVSTGTGAGVKFDFEYKQNYETTIYVNQHDLTGKLSYSLALISVFPVAINPMGLSWDAQNAIQKVPVTFAYRYFMLPS
jgi:hypothetical protein